MIHHRSLILALGVVLLAGPPLAGREAPALRYGPAASVGMDQGVLDRAVKLFSETVSYGFGWMIAADGTLSHSGSDGTYAWVVRSRDLLGIVFTQSAGGINPVAEFQKLVESATNPAK